VLVLVVGWETGWGKVLTRHPAPAEPIAPKPVVASLLPEYSIPGGPAGHPEMVQRTLFNPTRRPAPAAPEATASRLQRGQFALTGTLMIDGKSTAFLREVQGNKARRVLAGDKINGMVVAEVRPDRVKLTLGDESEELLLKVGTNPRPTTQPAAPVTAAVAPPPTAQAAAPAAAPVATPAATEPPKPWPNAVGREAAAMQQQRATGAAQAVPPKASRPRPPRATNSGATPPAGVLPATASAGRSIAGTHDEFRR
jgi:hypothetical protein